MRNELYIDMLRDPGVEKMHSELGGFVSRVVSQKESEGQSIRYIYSRSITYV